jgi:hypothetical protein
VTVHGEFITRSRQVHVLFPNDIALRRLWRSHVQLAIAIEIKSRRDCNPSCRRPAIQLNRKQPHDRRRE